jgi:hypothetical protein
MVGISIWERVWLKNSWCKLVEGDGLGVGPFTNQWECNDPHGGHGRVCETNMARVRVHQGMEGQNYCFVGGCLLPLSLCRMGFQDLLKVRPSSLFILCGCISSSVASLMSRSMYPILAERSFVSCSLITLSRLMLCSATADLSGCASLICLLFSLIRSWTDRPLCPI